jgi:hypothetical protein
MTFSVAILRKIHTSYNLADDGPGTEEAEVLTIGEVRIYVLLDIVSLVSTRSSHLTLRSSLFSLCFFLQKERLKVSGNGGSEEMKWKIHRQRRITEGDEGYEAK